MEEKDFQLVEKASNETVSIFEGMDEEEAIGKLDSQITEWISIREETIQKLREISDYIDKVAKKSTIAKAVSSSSGAVAGTLGVIGGSLTLASAGSAAVPILFIGKSSLNRMFTNQDLERILMKTCCKDLSLRLL